MRVHVLASLLLVLATNAFARPESLVLKRFQSMISLQDLDLFSSEEGLWFLDDDGRPVQAKLDMPTTRGSLFVSMEDHVEFHLYTRDVPGSEVIKVNDVDLLKKSHFNPKRETKFVTHGWVNSQKSKACTLVRDAFLTRGDYNVIVVDWSRITLRPYGWAASHVLDVGKYVARMLDFLADEGTNHNTTTLAGHSLGAHVMGLAGYYAENQVNYVIGLDPALPLFSLAGAGSRISTLDARHVEIIHTNAGLLGYLNAIGKADFYPNGGKKQLGCLIDLGGSCSHARSYEFYAESIVSDIGFYGKACKDYDSFKDGTCKGDVGVMGGTKRFLPYKGTYYLGTKAKTPYAKGKLV